MDIKRGLGLILALSIAGCDGGKNHHDIPMTTGAMKPHCAGHSLIDLPDDYALKLGVFGLFTPEQDVVEDGNIDLQVLPLTGTEEYQRQLTLRHAELANDSGLSSKLSEVRDLPGDLKLFRVHIIDDAYQSEVHWQLGDRHLVATVKSFKNQVAQAEAMLVAFVHNVAAENDTTDTQGAFCLGGVTVKGKYRAESSSFDFSAPTAPDIAFSLDIDTYGKDDTETLHQRFGGPDSLLKKFDIKQTVLRKDERPVAGMRAQEWISVLRPGEHGDRDLSLYLETMRPRPSPAAPKIHLEMHVTGQSAHDEKGAMALWDRVVITVRQR